MHRVFLAFTAVIALVPSIAAGERLPIRAYTTTDGLAHNDVNKIVHDRRGFLWFATNDGLSRFDGYSFSHYSVEQGLPHRTVTDLLQTSSGELWVATFGGVVRFHPEGRPDARVVQANDVRGAPPMFSVVVPGDTDPRARAVTVLLEARDGTIWCGTRKGLFRLERTRGTLALLPIEIGIPDNKWESGYLNDLLEDEYGSLWVAGTTGLYRRWPDGATARYTASDRLPSDYLEELLQDRRGRLWVASRTGGLFRLAVDGSRKPPITVEHYGGFWALCLLQTSDGKFWVGTPTGLLEFSPDADDSAARFRVYVRRNGLTHDGVTTLAEDSDGNLWIGTDVAGGMKLARNGFVTYTEQDGLLAALDVFDDATGDVYVRALTVWGTPVHTYPPSKSAARTAGGYANRWGHLTRHGFEWFQPGPPFGFGWVGNGVTVQTRAGEWWIAGDVGIYRFPASPSFARLESLRRSQTYTLRDGLAAEQAYRIFEDSKGNIWISSIGRSFGLARWEPATRVLRDIANAPGLPPADELARSFGEDRSGSVWIGFSTGAARYQSGHFRFFSARDGLPAGNIVDIYTDLDGRIWLGSSQGGLIRVDDSNPERPVFTAYTTSQGLSGNSVEAITEDLYGRIYAATGRGLDQLDPKTGRVRHFTAADGLAPGAVVTAFRDRTGTLWFATYQGLSRFSPPPPSRSVPPGVFVTGLTVAGEPRTVSAIGDTEIAVPDLRHDANQLDITFVAPGFAPGESLRYQYRLEGAAGEWSPLTTRRNVSYASLSPGTYRFLVRAVNADGVTSSTSAAVGFTVMPPLWQRWWFLSLIALAVTASVLMLHKYKVARVLEIERVRTRIATDLHDDVGANLTRIAILSEVARQQPRRDAPELDGPLSSIADIARESVATMSDIVWAITPERDTLREMVRRMRSQAEEVFESRDIRVILDLPDLDQPTRLGVDIRRDLYLVFKEAINNAARHSACSTVAITLRATGSDLSLEVTDDGVGFDLARGSEGNGLGSMRRRADRLGGSLDVVSVPGGGTTVRLRMPIRESAVRAHPTPKGR